MKDRAVILIRAVTRDQSLGALLQPVVVDTSSGKIVWTEKPYHPGKEVNSKIDLPPWDEKGVVIPGEERGWAILRLKQQGGTAPASATARSGDTGAASRPAPIEDTK